MDKKYKEFNKCKKLLIKMSSDIPAENTDEYFQIMVKFKNNSNESWHYHVPNRAFANQDQIIKYFQENQESEWLKVKVKRITDISVS